MAFLPNDRSLLDSFYDDFSGIIPHLQFVDYWLSFLLKFLSQFSLVVVLTFQCRSLINRASRARKVQMTQTAVEKKRKPRKRTACSNFFLKTSPGHLHLSSNGFTWQCMSHIISRHLHRDSRPITMLTRLPEFVESHILSM